MAKDTTRKSKAVEKAAKPERQGTSYVVLKRIRPEGFDFDSWVPFTEPAAEEGVEPKLRVVAARNDTHAIDQVVGTGPEAEQGDYKGVPLRSWRGGKRVLAPKQVANTEPLFEEVET